MSDNLQSYVVVTHEIDGKRCSPNHAQIMLRTLQLLRSIKREGYKPHSAGTIAISMRIEELEEAIEGVKHI